MSILQYRSEELMNARYKASEAKQTGDDLIVGNKQANNPRVAADTLQYELTVIPEVNSVAYFDELLSGGH